MPPKLSESKPPSADQKIKEFLAAIQENMPAIKQTMEDMFKAWSEVQQAEPFPRPGLPDTATLGADFDNGASLEEREATLERRRVNFRGRQIVGLAEEILLVKLRTHTSLPMQVLVKDSFDTAHNFFQFVDTIHKEPDELYEI